MGAGKDLLNHQTADREEEMTRYSLLLEVAEIIAWLANIMFTFLECRPPLALPSANGLKTAGGFLLYSLSQRPRMGERREKAIFFTFLLYTR